MPAISVAGSQVYFRGGATGCFTLVLVHGAAHTGAKWDRILSQVANAVAPDLPGHGWSAGRPLPTLADYAAWLKEFADALELERPIAVGHSMGGAICLQGALDSGPWVGLGLVGTGARLRVLPDFLEKLRAGGVPDDLAERMLSPFAYPAQISQEEASLVACDPAVRAADFEACDAFDVRNRLGEIGLPTEVMVGSLDRMTPRGYAQFLAERLEGARLTEVPEAGHLLMVERPAAVVKGLGRLVERVLRKADGEGSAARR